MRELWLRTTVSVKLRMLRWYEAFTEEKGAHEFVSIIAIIIVILAIAGIFKQQLTGVVNAVFSKITDFIEAS